MREHVGTSMIYTTCASFGVNFLVIGHETLSSIVRKLRLRYLRYKKVVKMEREREERLERLR